MVGPDWLDEMKKIMSGGGMMITTHNAHIYHTLT